MKIKEIKKISIKEFREFGFLQEVNRQFFHPLGLALEIKIDDDENEYLGDIWDFREDPEGIIYGEVNEELHKARIEKFNRVKEFQKEKFKLRENTLGYIIQSFET